MDHTEDQTILKQSYVTSVKTALNAFQVLPLNLSIDRKKEE